jgi:hypothetical protein
MKEKDYTLDLWIFLLCIGFINLGYVLSYVYKPIELILFNVFWIFTYIIVIFIKEYLIKHKVKK